MSELFRGKITAAMLYDLSVFREEQEKYTCINSARSCNRNLGYAKETNVTHSVRNLKDRGLVESVPIKEGISRIRATREKPHPDLWATAKSMRSGLEFFQKEFGINSHMARMMVAISACVFCELPFRIRDGLAIGVNGLPMIGVSNITHAKRQLGKVGLVTWAESRQNNLYEIDREAFRKIAEHFQVGYYLDRPSWKEFHGQTVEWIIRPSTRLKRLSNQG